MIFPWRKILYFLFWIPLMFISGDLINHNSQLGNGLMYKPVRSHYLSQSWSISLIHICNARPQWVKSYCVRVIPVGFLVLLMQQNFNRHWTLCVLDCFRKRYLIICICIIRGTYTHKLWKSTLWTHINLFICSMWSLVCLIMATGTLFKTKTVFKCEEI